MTEENEQGRYEDKIRRLKNTIEWIDRERLNLVNEIHNLRRQQNTHSVFTDQCHCGMRQCDCGHAQCD